MRKRRNLKRWLKEFFSGDFITNKELNKYVGFIVFVFWLFVLFIMWNLNVENKLVKVVDGENKIKELKIYRDQTSIELLKLDHRDIVEDLLEKNHSKLVAPTEPATVIE